jgi:hypothetical protein
MQPVACTLYAVAVQLNPPGPALAYQLIAVLCGMPLARLVVDSYSTVNDRSLRTRAHMAHATYSTSEHGLGVYVCRREEARSGYDRARPPLSSDLPEESLLGCQGSHLYQIRLDERVSEGLPFGFEKTDPRRSEGFGNCKLGAS